MKAELHGKTDGVSEDTLTDAVVSTISYLPRSVLFDWLEAAFPSTGWSATDVEDAEFFFWPTFDTGTEPDVVIRVGSRVVVIEAKYESPFSDSHGEPTEHQLVREWRDGRAWSRARGLEGPWLLALTADLRQPPDINGARATLDEFEGPFIEGMQPTNSLSWQRWQDVAAMLEEARSRASLSCQLMIDDCLHLMERRGVRFVFDGIAPEDYWLLASAERVASERVYPKVAVFAKELIGLLAEDDIAWGSAAGQGVVAYGSLSFGKPQEWGRTYLLLPFWPEGMALPKKQSAYLYAMFNLLDARLEVGYMQVAPTYSDSKTKWTPFAAKLCEQLQTLPAEYEIGTSNGDLARAAEFRTVEALDEAWVEHAFSSSRHLFVRRTRDLGRVVDTDSVRTLIVEDRDHFCGDGIYREMLVACDLLPEADNANEL